MNPLLGWIAPQDRTQDQHDAHDAAVQGMVKHFALPVPTLAKGERISLFDFWKNPVVVADVGFTFSRIHQLTGSCVWAGGTNALFSTIAVQRLAADAPTKAFLPFTLGNYAMSRHYMGDDGQGSGSLGSTFAKSLATEGVRDWPNNGADSLPTFTDTDGLSVKGSSVEFQWSSYRNPQLAAVLAASKPHLLGSAAEAKSVQDIKAFIANGYGVSFACDRNIGNASIHGSGADACVMGSWDSGGGHQQSIHAVWEHPTLGTLYWAQNSWPGSVYPRDPAGGPVCGCWVTEANVQRAMGYHGEVYGLSHLNWFPAQPAVLSYVY